MKIRLLNQDYSKFLGIILVSIWLTRLWIIVSLNVLGTSQLGMQIMYDSWHHYHFGFLLIVLGLFLRKVRYRKVLVAVGIGIILEEWAILLDDLGLGTKRLYDTNRDFLSIVTVVGLSYFAVKFMRQKYFKH